MLNRNISDPTTNDNNHKTAHHNSNPIEQGLYEATRKVLSDSPPHSESQDRSSYKIEEIKKLWKQYFSPQSLDYVSRCLALQIIEDGGDDSFIDKFLAELNEKVNFKEPS